MPLPTIGEPLSRAADAYSTLVKWREWILADEHHGPEWSTVFGSVDRETIWPALAEAILISPVLALREVADGGLSCRVDVSLTLNNRTSTVRTAWHYADEDDAPRLVTAFPTT